jgi:regulatory protein
MIEKPILTALRTKLEYYCSYQDRCYQEVVAKLQQLQTPKPEAEKVLIHLIENDFLNEERFARSFVRGKHRIKYWGKIRIVNELKQRQISTPIIKLALTEISDEDYQNTFNQLAEKHWDTLTEADVQRKKKKWCDYLLRKGWENHLVYEKMKEL